VLIELQKSEITALPISSTHQLQQLDVAAGTQTAAGLDVLCVKVLCVVVRVLF
jgi:hypothetical protein